MGLAGPRGTMFCLAVSGGLGTRITPDLGVGRCEDSVLRPLGPAAARWVCLRTPQPHYRAAPPALHARYGRRYHAVRRLRRPEMGARELGSVSELSASTICVLGTLLPPHLLLLRRACSRATGDPAEHRQPDEAELPTQPRVQHQVRPAALCAQGAPRAVSLLFQPVLSAGGTLTVLPAL